MTELFELQLPPGRSEGVVDIDGHQLYVQTALAAAITEQAEDLVLPSLERLSGCFGLNRATVMRLRTTLVQTGHLERLGHIYITRHPKHDNDIERATDRG